MSKLTSSCLSLTSPELKKYGAGYTAREINQQPQLWGKTYKKFLGETEEIELFVRHALKEIDQILFTGAGTSSFIGLSLVGIYFRKFGIHSVSVPTTDIVTSPENYFSHSTTSLIISFARSGQSPESVTALKLADQFSIKCYHLIITCDASGALANYESKNPMKVFVLPQEANDKSLAMTGSYSSMLLSGLLISYIKDLTSGFLNEQFEFSQKAAKKILNENVDLLKKISSKNFRRAVFLGSGPLYGTALEGSLKLQELTNGSVICKADTFLGFRHGPKAVVNNETLIVYFINNNPYVRRYEMDLINSMRKGSDPLIQLGISDLPVNTTRLDYQINLGEDGGPLDEYFQTLSFILPAQILGFFKSLNVGLSPDNPSPKGAISRVVQGVTIYPEEKEISLH